MNTTIAMLIGYYSAIYGVDPNLALAVAKVESNFQVDAVGQAGEIGLFQILPSVYPQVKENFLFNTKHNIELGIKHLAWSKKHCKYKKQHMYVLCWNRGVTGASRMQKPTADAYYKKVMNTYREYKKD